MTPRLHVMGTRWRGASAIVAVCCSVLLYVAVCWRAWQYIAVCWQGFAVYCSVLHEALAVWCSVLQGVAVCCSVV